ncbi:type 1 glutamine amidotransferase domain-containing protein [Cronobacter malonaticus]|uniref:Type 1 glutamine amidotransferase domain-containing protein n=1 Tax=Cronobacter malonaticus TaxID=413503 RepID=A0A423XS36_9ENTR|nr:type 1 glutamine amidotransferase domain-containing protein [Cronobacter malonaticus]EGT4382353.1 type 1 glutamine amidotransferase domain-containing protein [Cronobacter malonaticus]EGT4419464.1 type 1 glutamine amidotransferase domain-containing protein [Cronobacter malonaticus]EGT4444520.1 type 1 glutamine amidotransferase domain-containing protein [Cronobacter malonaticus]EGT4453547.1 type 1 glutamine amidotransferase domain-containing protein [Cronobacter malonaticus]MBF4661049.1 type 
MKIVRHLALAAALGLSALNAHAASVLVVLSDSDHLDLKDGKVFPTGFYLNELMQPVKRLLDAGHQVTFATPSGLAPTLDKSSDDKMYFNNDVNAWRTHRALLDKLKLTSAASSPVISLARAAQRGYGEFDAIYIPGGHAPMQDLLTSPALGKALAAFHAAGKPTALVCHGPIALLSTLPDAPAFTRQLAETGHAAAQPGWIYAGYRMTVISNAEEEIAKGLLPKGGAMKFYPQTALEQAGGKYSSNTEPFTSHIVTDRELITGQNPASATAVAQALLERLH